jgi:secretion/DNA translocation related TadE-like protein
MVVAVLGVLMLLGAALGVVAAMVAAHRRAQAAADLAALGGAQILRNGGDPCSQAAALATANGAALTSCAVQGSAVLVQVRVAGPRWLGRHDDLSAQARAGPAP